jgi:hypothetical protein
MPDTPLTASLFFAVTAGIHGVAGLVVSLVGLVMAAYLVMLFLMILKRGHAVLGHELRQQLDALSPAPCWPRATIIWASDPESSCLASH